MLDGVTLEPLNYGFEDSKQWVNFKPSQRYVYSPSDLNLYLGGTVSNVASGMTSIDTKFQEKKLDMEYFATNSLISIYDHNNKRFIGLNYDADRLWQGLSEYAKQCADAEESCKRIKSLSQKLNNDYAHVQYPKIARPSLHEKAPSWNIQETYIKSLKIGEQMTKTDNLSSCVAQSQSFTYVDATNKDPKLSNDLLVLERKYGYKFEKSCIKTKTISPNEGETSSSECYD